MKVLKYTTGQSPSNTPSAKSQGDRFQTRPSTLVGQQPICRMTRKTLLQKIYWTSAGLATLVIAFIVSVTFLNPSSVGNTAFVANINLWAFIWAVNFLLFLILCFILARDLTRIYFEYRSKKPGRRIKTKLIITFTLFSLFPAVLMSFLAFGLINSNLQLWFTSPSEQLLESAEAVVDTFYEQNRRLVHESLRQVAASVDPEHLRLQEQGGDAQLPLSLEGLAIYSLEKEQVWSRNWRSEDVSPALEQALRGESPYHRRRGNEVNRADIDLVLAARPIRDGAGAITGALLAQHIVPASVEFNTLEAVKARVTFNALKSSLRQLQVNYILILAVTTLAMICGFVWLGTYIARKITVPLEALASGAHQLSDGNLDYRVKVAAADELGVLVDSFNRMATEILESRRELEKANDELVHTNKELAEGRNYIERILQNIGTGVMSVDQDDIVQTVNQAALRILKSRREEVVGQPLKKVGGRNIYQHFAKMKQRARLYDSYRREIVLSRADQQVYIAATVTANPQTTGSREEFLVVLDELTELIRAEKFAAWQEVARRLAHEIKNPLTPIQLSAARVSSRFTTLDHSNPAALSEFGGVLQDSVGIITAEAQALKVLVEEFSRFARLPISKPTETGLHQLIEQTLEIYDGSMSSVQIRKNFDPRISTVMVDPEQMRRVFVNLIDNSLDALADCEYERTLTIATRFKPASESVTVEFADNGAGVAVEDYENLFFPYFSKKTKGTGLGLAIVQQIVNDHSGYVRAEPNQPRGMKFRIEIPVHQLSRDEEVRGVS